MAINEYYIDAGGGSDSSGDGSSGNPWATLYYAWANSSHGTSGVRFWLYGTHTLASTGTGSGYLSGRLPVSAESSGVIPYSSIERPIRFQGWDKLGAGTAYPGTINTSGITASATTGVHDGRLFDQSQYHRRLVFRDLEFVDTALYLSGDHCVASNCYFRPTSQFKVSGVYLGAWSIIENCHIEANAYYSGGSYGLTFINNFITDDYFFLSTTTGHFHDFWEAGGTSYTLVKPGGGASKMSRNIFAVTGAVPCFEILQGVNIDHNSILRTGGSFGWYANARTPAITTAARGVGYLGLLEYTDGINPVNQGTIISNNIVEGYETKKAFEITDGSGVQVVAGNAAYNNGTDYDLDATYGATGDTYMQSSGPCPYVPAIESDNESLSASPFAKSGALTFDNRFTYFAPNNVGNVLGGAYNGQGTLDKGAVQTPSGYVSSSGSDMLTNPGMAGGMRG